MAQIFISYAREDRAFAQRLAEALEKRGFKVWWDWNLIGGHEFRTRIREAIGQADKAIVLWSKHSVGSGFVIDEASEARKSGKLVPLRIDDCETPFGFGDLHTIDFHHPEDDIDTLDAALKNQPPQLRTVASRRNFGAGIGAAGLTVLAVLLVGSGYWFFRKSGGSVARASIAGVWKCNDGGRYTIRQSGDSITWQGVSGDVGRSWTHTFNGTIQDNVINGSYTDHPPGFARGSGALSVRIVNSKRLEKTFGPNFGGSIWER